MPRTTSTTSDPTTARLTAAAIARVAVVHRRASDRLDVVAASPPTVADRASEQRVGMRRIPREDGDGA